MSTFKTFIIPCLLLLFFAGACSKASYEDGLDAYGRKDYAAAFNIFKALSEQGDKRAQFSLGDMYAEGQGTAQDDGEALKWFRKSADQGYAIAQYNLGTLYGTGRGTKRDIGEAEKWWRLAAQQGNPNAEYDLGNLYKFGWAGKADLPQAIGWYRKAAIHKFPPGESDLAFLYHSGQGVPQDDAAAFAGFSDAADQGYAPAQFALAQLYLGGLDGLPNAAATGTKWLQRAAQQGLLPAVLLLGTNYYKGIGVTQDYSGAYFWLSLGARLDTSTLDEGSKKIAETAKPLRALAEKKLSPPDLNDLNRLLTRWHHVTEPLPSRGVLLPTTQPADPGPTDLVTSLAGEAAAGNRSAGVKTSMFCEAQARVANMAFEEQRPCPAEPFWDKVGAICHSAEARGWLQKLASEKGNRWAQQALADNDAAQGDFASAYQWYMIAFRATPGGWERPFLLQRAGWMALKMEGPQLTDAKRRLAAWRPKGAYAAVDTKDIEGILKGSWLNPFHGEQQACNGADVR